jgi:hypothetical protein
MRHKEKCSLRGKQSQEIQENSRLSAALNYQPIESFIVFEIETHNPRTSQRQNLEIRHDPGNGNIGEVFCKWPEKD